MAAEKHLRLDEEKMRIDLDSREYLWNFSVKKDYGAKTFLSYAGSDKIRTDVFVIVLADWIFWFANPARASDFW